jgi:hypothetical protein
MMSIADQDCYELGTGCSAVYGFDYTPGFVQDNAVFTFPPASGLANHRLIRCFLSRSQYISWINNNQTAWTMNVNGTSADDRVKIGPRPVPQEPMVRTSSFAYPLSQLFHERTHSLITFVDSLSV